MAVSAEFSKWSNYYGLIFDKRASLKLKKAVLKEAPVKFILSIEEILLNIQVMNFRRYMILK